VNPAFSIESDQPCNGLADGDAQDDGEVVQRRPRALVQIRLRAFAKSGD
jgi:hypothetical protein